MKVEASKIAAELSPPPTITTQSGEVIPIPGLPMRRTVLLFKQIQGGFGELLDQIQGNLPPDIIKRISGLDSEEERDRVIREYLQSTDASWNGHLKRYLDKADVLFETIGLMIGKDAEWVGDNLHLPDCVQIIAHVLRQELSGGFFGGVGLIREVWGDVQRLQETPTTTPTMSHTAPTDPLLMTSAGSGSSSPN